MQPPRDIWGTGPRSRFRDLGRFGIEMPINVFADEVLAPGEGKIKALICVGGNPAVAFPDQRKVLAALISDRRLTPKAITEAFTSSPGAPA